MASPQKQKSVTNEYGQISRRTLVKGLLSGAAALVIPGTLPVALHAKEHEPVVRISNEKVARIPENFTGLSYESSQLSHPRFFSAENRDLIQFFGTLGDRGVLRLGGNMSEFTKWHAGRLARQYF